MFIDYIYVYGYVANSNLVDKGVKTLLSTGGTGHANRVVATIQVCMVLHSELEKLSFLFVAESKSYSV